MSQLSELQTAFQHHLLDNTKKNIQRAIISTARMPAEKRLGIYAHAYYSRLVEALGANYPLLLLYLGETAFNQLGYDYAKQFPSSYRSIRWFGDKFSLFLSEHPDYQDYPYLAELAQIEWTMCAVFDAPDHSVLLLEELGNIPPEKWLNMQLHAHPSLRTLTLTWNSMQIWQALNRDEHPGKAALYDIPITWLFWRQDLINHFCSLIPQDAWAIEAVLNGLTFGEICAGLTQWYEEEEVSQYVAALLKGWIAAGLISGVSV